MCEKRQKISLVGIGMGTFGNDRYSSEEVSDAVYGAIKAGYRLFDCAAAYGNEKEIGQVFRKAFADGIVQREDLTIMTKVWNDRHGEGDPGQRYPHLCQQG